MKSLILDLSNTRICSSKIAEFCGSPICPVNVNMYNLDSAQTRKTEPYILKWISPLFTCRICRICPAPDYQSINTLGSISDCRLASRRNTKLRGDNPKRSTDAAPIKLLRHHRTLTSTWFS